MAYTPLTELGKQFIVKVCETGGSKLLSGQKKASLPYSIPSQAGKTWTCNIDNPLNLGNKISTASQLAQALIYWFDKYAKIYELDANVIAAQAYAESNYVMWTYAEGSTASGVNQFTMITVYGIIVMNQGGALHIGSTQIAKIINGLIDPLNKNSYDVNSKDYTNAFTNHPVLHQNIIDNPDVMIQAQCRYMKNIANNCNSFASTSLFCYSRGIAFEKSTYTKAINKCKNDETDKYLEEGLNYVLRIFGILGDKDNWLEKNGKVSRGYKPTGYYFGYDEQMGNSPKNLRLKETWNAFDANVAESSEYGITGYGNDPVVKDLSLLPNYKFIYYPESDYYNTVTKKTQIILHHTVSGDNVQSDIQWWEKQVQVTGNKVATAFIVSRRGEIFQLFSTDYWAYQLGISKEIINDYNLPSATNQTLNQQGIGIEIDSWGGLVQSGGNWYPATTDDYHPQKYVANTKEKPIPVENVVQYNASNGYPQGFHGFFGFERYTDAQIESVRQIIVAVKKRFTDIRMGYVNDIYVGANMWGHYNSTTNTWTAETLALQGKPGIWTHVSYRPDKSDCDPQPELIAMLQSLK